jgi:hypothetical protein
VNVAGRGGLAVRQVRIKKRNASEPLRKCRRTPTDVDPRLSPAKQVEGYLFYGSTVVRHEGRVILIQGEEKMSEITA